MRPANVLLIVLDAVRYDHLSCYGYERPTTPYLERLAEEGIIFDNAFATAPWTPPSHASMFTGTYPSSHGVDVDENLHLKSEIPYMAEILASKDYATFAVLPDAHLSESRGFHRGFSRFSEIFRLPYLSPDYDAGMGLMYNLLWGRDARAYHSSRILKKWIGNHLRQSQKPFFAFLNYKTAHNTYRSPRPFRRRFAIPLEPGQDAQKLQRYVDGGGYLYMADGLEMSERDMEVARSWYDGAVAYMDHRIQDLLDFLKQEGAYDDTLVIITADHGENFGDHGLAYHLFCLYDSLIHVPLLMIWPRLGKGGKRITNLASLADILPTVLDLIGCDPDEYPGMQGKSLAPFDDREIHPQIFAEFGRPHYMLKRLTSRFPRHDFSKFDRALQCVRTKELKLIVGSDGSRELYHLPSDPGETTNLVAQRPGEAQILAQALQKELNLSQRESTAPPPSEEDPAIIKNLQDLGYF